MNTKAAHGLLLLFMANKNPVLCSPYMKRCLFSTLKIGLQKVKKAILLWLVIAVFTSCDRPNVKVEPDNPKTMSSTVKDIHSFARPDEAVVKHIDLDIKVDFDSSTISGKAILTIENLKNADTIVLDTKDMAVTKVTEGADEKAVQFALADEIKYLGRALNIPIKPDTKTITVYYKTEPQAAALQWLTPQQTAGGKYPFLFTQSEAILARTWVPCQDGPGVRFTYNATVQVPKELMALMSASNPEEKSADGIYHFEMKQPIPSYLLALAVGDIAFRKLTDNTGVYAEPVTLDKAAWEFADMHKMLEAAEKLYGPYRWDRYDVLVLPPSFPFGGMENPRLTFATPTILAGDRSLVSLVAHELAHSWSGNLVTNATWNDFWLNEGFTVYFERRIMEALEGKGYADMLEVLGYQDLKTTVKELGVNSNDTKLKLDLKDRDPDDGMTQIAYEKGYFLLRLMEEHVGRPRFDAFVKEYFNTFAFQSMTTEKFLAYLDTTLLKDDKAFQKEVERWIYSTGIPDDIIVVKSARFEKVNQTLKDWEGGKPAASLDTKNWSSHEWLNFIRNLPTDMTVAQMTELDNAFHFSNSGNSEILAAWFLHVIAHNYTQAYPQMDKFMMTVGRRKFIVPLYKALMQTPDGKARAKDIYHKARPNYHPVATSTLDEVVGNG
jgi:leukotriene A-4 hydrolase/aminopeptidase